MGEKIVKKLKLLLFYKFILVFLIAISINFIMDFDINFNEICESLIIASIAIFITYLFIKKDIKNIKSIL